MIKYIANFCLKNNFFKKLLVCLFSIPLFLLAGCNSKQKIHIYNTEEQKKINGSDPKVVDFIFTPKEQTEMHKWKDLPMEQLYEDAFNCDRVALFNLASYFLLGIDHPVNFDMANLLYAKSASLGYAPALYDISKMYLNDESNAFLALVYRNLTIAFGHTEFIEMYHELRNKALKTFGKEVVREIESLAASKMQIILKNQQDLGVTSNKKEFFEKMRTITDEDVIYNNEYWKKLYLKDKKKENKQPWYLRIDSLPVNADTKEFLKLTANGFLKIPKLLGFKLTDQDIRCYLLNNVPELMNTKEGRDEICNQLRSLLSIPEIRFQALEQIDRDFKEDDERLLRDDFIEKEINKLTGNQVNEIISNFKKIIKY